MLQGSITPAEKEACLKHLLELMVLASTYTWSAVRALYGTALKELEKGHREWSEPLSNLKEEVLRPSDVVRFQSREPSVSTGDPAFCQAYNYMED